MFGILGNIFGPAVDIVMNGLADKLKIPKGCGEQTMIYTAPGVYAYRYNENIYIIFIIQ